MIVDYEYKNKNIILSYVQEDGKVGIEHIKMENPYNWVECSSYDNKKDAVLTTWDRFPVKKEYVDKPNKHSVSYYLETLNDDIKNKIFGFKKPKTYFMDIETEILDEFPNPKYAKAAVLSISIACGLTVLVLATKPLDNAAAWESIQQNTNTYFEKFGKTFKFVFKQFDNEHKMLSYLISTLLPTMPVITGWNYVNFDWFYLMTRAKNMGIPIEKCSLTGKMHHYKDDTDETHYIIPAHKIVVDYLDLYKKWNTSVKIKDSNKLDFVSDKLLELHKIHYEGNLMQLYNNDYTTFIYYNIVDTLLVYFIDEQCKYIDIMLAISELAKVKMVDSLGTVGVTEGILRGPLLKERNIVFVQKDKESEENVEGGYVKTPLPGMKFNMCIFDFASLYPTIIRQHNLVPESYVGVYDKQKNIAKYKGRETDLSKGIYIINPHGTVFINEESTTKGIFTKIYSDRKKFKKLMSQKKEELKEAKKKLKALEKMLAFA